jgi:hypothetical protein
MGALDPATFDSEAGLGFALVCGLPAALLWAGRWFFRHHRRDLGRMGDTFAAHMQLGRWVAAFSHLLGGLCAAFVMTALLLVFSASEFTPLRLLVFSLTYAWPVVLTSRLLLGGTRRTALVILGIYFGCFTAASAKLLSASPDIPWWEPAKILLLANILPTLLVELARSRKLLIAAAYSFAGILALGLGFSVAEGAGPVFTVVLGTLFVMYMLGQTTMEAARWLYRTRLAGQQSLAAYSIWLVFVAMFAFSLVPDHGIGAAAFCAFVSFAVYLTATRWLERWLNKGPARKPPRLLWLRFHPLPASIEPVREALNKSWRYGGNVIMLADVELAPSSEQRSGFLSFLVRELDSAFITEIPALGSVLDELDKDAGEPDEPDKDGRFRELDLFCSSQVWPDAFDQISARCNVVLIDLRGFAAANSGCRLRLDQVLSSMPPEHAVLMIDGATQLDLLLPFLERTQLQRRAKKNNESHLFASPVLLPFAGANARDMDQLARVLCAAAQRDVVDAAPSDLATHPGLRMANG